MNAWWQRHWNHKAICPECGRLIRIGMPHSREQTTVELARSWSDSDLSPLWVRCKGVPR